MRNENRALAYQGAKSALSWKTLYSVLAILLVLGLLNAIGSAAQASHVAGWDWGGNQAGEVAANWHQTNIHSNTANESVCFISSSAHITTGTFRTTVIDKLFRTNRAGQLNPANFDELNNNKIYFTAPLFGGTQTSPKACNQLTQTERNTIAIEMYLAHNVTTAAAGWQGPSPCASIGNYACADNRFRVWNSIAKHYDMMYGFVWFPEAALYNTSTHAQVPNPQWVINHEAGHILGLDDGLSGGQCNSIMHAGKDPACPIGNALWPTQPDRDSITTLSNRVDNCIRNDTNPTKCP